MKRNLRRIILPIIAVMFLAPWPIAYAYDTQAAPQPFTITPAEAARMPAATIFGQTINGIRPGDLFYVKTAVNTDFTATLTITNAHELARNYRYITLKVGVYVADNNGNWKKAAQNDGKAIPDTFITLQNGQVRFNLVGGVDYKITIDGGALNCVTTNAAGGNIAPQFFLEVD